MKRTKKILKLVALSVIVLVVILCASFYLFGERMLKTGVETAATKALGVVVSIDDVDLSILKGAVGINGLIVGNPPGYAHKNLLELNNGRIEVSIGSLLDDTVHIKELKLDGINLVIEQKALSNNLQDVISSLPAKDKQESEPTGKKLHIDELEVTNIKVKVKLLPIPGKADTVTLNLAPIRMSDLGADNKLGAGILAKKIMVAIASGVAEQGVGVLPKEMVTAMKSTLDEAVNIGKTVSKEGEKLLEAGKDAGAELVEGFKDLLKPRKKE